jgi:hypothetical protein
VYKKSFTLEAFLAADFFFGFFSSFSSSLSESFFYDLKEIKIYLNKLCDHFILTLETFLSDFFLGFSCSSSSFFLVDLIGF